MIGYILEHILVFGVCIFAMRSGGWPEKIAGAWLATNVSIFALAVAFERHTPTLSLVCDAIFSIGLLPLAIYSVSWAVGVICFIQTGSFMMQAFYLINEQPADRLFFVLNSTACWGIVICLFISTAASIRHRRGLELDRRPGPPKRASYGAQLMARLSWD